MNQQEKIYDVIILGGGISGLTCSFYLGDTPHLLLEKTDRLGGAIRSLQMNGGILECGPNFLLLRKNEAKDIIHELGLDHELLSPDTTSQTRYVWLERGLIALTPLSLFKHLIFKSPLTLWKFFMGGCSWRRPHIGETVFEFFSRKFSPYFAQNFSVPMVSGVYGGDAKKIQMTLAFPLFAKWDKTFNSFWPGALVHLLKKGKHKIPSGLYSFSKGLEQMVHQLSIKSHGKIEKNQEVISLEYTDQIWKITTSAAQYYSRKLVSTLPPSTMMNLLAPLAPELSEPFSKITSPWISVLFLGYKTKQIQAQPKGFGFLNSLILKRDFLGCFYSSSMFPNRFSPDETIFTIFVGGALRQDLKTHASDLLIKAVHQELVSLFQIEGELAWSHAYAHPEAIPQYTEEIARLRKCISENKLFNGSLYFASNCQLGVSIPDCMINAKNIAKSI